MAQDISELIAQNIEQNELTSLLGDTFGFIRVSEYKAKGDGTDDTVAFQKAVTQANADGKREIFLLGGKTYLVNALTDAEDIVWIGDGVTITGDSEGVIVPVSFGQNYQDILNDINGDINAHVTGKEGELDTYVTGKEGELGAYALVKQDELDVHTLAKQGELDAYALVKEGELDTHTLIKEGELDAHTTAKELELDTYVTTILGSSLPPPKGFSLKYYSWEQIQMISDSGLAEEYFSVGDEIDITLSTTEVMTMQIYGFGHDNLTAGGKAGITFGTKDLLATERRMEATNINTNGWNDSEMRGWLSGTLLGQLPSGLQDVVRQVDKLTSIGSGYSNIETAADKVFLFSEIEIVGAATYSKSGEGSKYAIFTDGASRVKNLSNGSGLANSWWPRSPFSSNSTQFCVVNSFGENNFANASLARGVAFGFCV